MQSSRRKRERAENDRQDLAVAPTSSRGRSATRGPPQKRLNISQPDSAAENDGGKNEVESTDDVPALADNVIQESQGTTSQGDKPNSGNNHSETVRDVTMALDKNGGENARPWPQSDAPSGGNTGSVKEGDSSAKADSSSKGSREQRMSALIAHRKLLLSRMKSCRSAALLGVARPNQPFQKEASGNAAAAASTGPAKQTSDINPTTRGGLSASDDEEIERFREESKKAVQASRKQRAEASEAAVEKRSSVSLRRGSSVGKRMNAALSSLAPGSTALPPGATVPQHQGVGIPAPVGAAAAAIPPAAAATQSLSKVAHNSKQASMNAALQRIQPTAQQSDAQPTPLIPNNQIRNYGGQQGQKNRRSSSSQRTLKSYPGAASTSAQLSQGALPLHVGAGASTSGMPFNRLASMHYPEALALREQRALIRNKLSALMQQRIEKMNKVDKSRTPDAPGTNLVSSISGRALQPQTFLPVSVSALEEGVSLPSKLPRRRKTHWDCVLEEMRWLATDFAEERKWKAACARTIASGVVSNRLNAVAPVASSSERTKETGSDGKKDDSGDEQQSMSVASSTGSAKQSDSNVERSYDSPSPSDLKLVQSKSRIISDMISEVWDATVTSGALSSSDGPLMTALSRHEKLRQTLENVADRKDARASAGEPASQDDAKSEAGPQHVPSQKDATVGKNDSVSRTTNGEKVAESAESSAALVESNQDGDQAKDVSAQSLSNGEISERIEAAADRVTNRKVRRNRIKSKNESTTLSTEQRKAVDFVEFIWSGDDMVGSVVDGPIACGKTVLSCSLLWRRRDKGPQLLVCPPARLIRWANELDRFADLRVSIFGLRCGIGSALPISQARDGTEFQPGDVVLCEYSFLAQLDRDATKANFELSAFRTIVVDARFPTESLQGEKRPALSNLTGCRNTTASKGELLIPPELISHEWWATVLRSLESCDGRRLLIDNHDSRFLREKDCLGYARLSDRRRLDSLAAMTAFVVGPGLFHSGKSSSPQHKVVSWAKHCAKDGNLNKKPQYDDVRGVLIDASLPLRHTFDSEKADSGHSSRMDEEDWDVRLCPLSASQRSAYDKCCIGARGALSFGSVADQWVGQDRSKAYQQAVQALLRLRRVCFHSQISQALNMSMASWTSVADPGSSAESMPTPVTFGPSQPDTDVAVEILSGSAKLRVLVAILRDECGYDIPGDAVTAQVDEIDNDKDGSGEEQLNDEMLKRKKVAILAMLPEAQLLTSILLSSIGVAHEFLSPPSLCKASAATHTASTKYDRLSEDNSERCMNATVAWVEAQLSLLNFSSDSLTRARSSHDVVIASPAIIGADNGGIGIGAADVVICLDEDWSGRGSLLLERIFRNHSFSRELKTRDGGNKRDGQNSYIRLVSAETCEQVFLSGFPEDDDSSAGGLESYSRDWQGFLDLPAAEPSVKISLDDDRLFDEDDVESHFRFPALNVLRYRGATLSKVLVSTVDIPAEFTTGDSVRFLPLRHYETDNGSHAGLVHTLIAHENVAVEPNVDAYSYGRNLQPDGMVNCFLISRTIPPLPADYPTAATSRHDMMVMASRVYVDRFGRSSVSLEASSSAKLPTTGILSGPTVKGSLSEVNTSMPADHANLADAWHRSGLSCKPGDMVSSLLFYGPPAALPGTSDASHTETRGQDRDDISQGLETRLGGIHSTVNEFEGQNVEYSSSWPRSNAFSSLFCSSQDVISNAVKDGSQGCEPLVYFPPLFPSLLGASARAMADAARFRGMHAMKMSAGGEVRMAGIPSEIEGGSRKRKDQGSSNFEMVIEPKRQRIENMPVASKTLGLPVGRPPVAHAQAPAMSYTGMHVGGLKALSAGNQRTSIPADASVVTEDESSYWDHASFLFEMGEDYGLLGVGALSSPNDSAREAAMLSTSTLAYASWNDPYEADGFDQELAPSMVSCDMEEVETLTRSKTDDFFLDTMLLFVTKRARVPTPSSYMGIPPNTHGLPSGLNLSGPVWAQMKSASGLPTTVPGGAAISNGVDGLSGTATKKSKKRAQSSGTTGAFARVNPADVSGRSVNPYVGSSLHNVKGKESYRSKVLSSILARQGGGRSTLFQVPSFLLASIRVRDTVLQRVLGIVPGQVPWIQAEYGGRRAWESVCFKLDSPSKKTGDASIEISKAQIVKMQSSTSNAPVDFGPFEVGCISSPYAVSYVLPARVRMGISLPLGVKISRRLAEQRVPPWHEREDARLKEAVARFGSNWHVVSRAVNASTALDTPQEAKSHGSYTLSRGMFKSNPRSPSQCHERWQYLVGREPSQTVEHVTAEKLRPENSVARPALSILKGRNAHRVAPTSKKSFGSDEYPLSLVLSSSPSVDKGAEKRPEEDTSPKDVEMKDAETESDKKEESKIAGGSKMAPLAAPQPKRSFAAFRNAAKKRRNIPMPIPGSVSGEKPALVGSHPSHVQSLQAAVAASTPGGRTEMWPLQMLDLADKQRASRRAARQMAASASTSRQQSSASMPPARSSAAHQSPARQVQRSASQTYAKARSQAGSPSKSPHARGKAAAIQPPVYAPTASGGSANGQSPPQRGAPKSRK